MDGSKGYPAARYVRIIKGAVDVEKGQAKEISGLKKIDDFTLEMTLTDRVDPGYSFFAGSTAILPKEEVEKGNFAANPVGLGPFKFKEHVPGSRVVAERFDKFYKPGKPYPTSSNVLIMAEAAARDVAFRNKEIDTSILGPGAVRRLSRGSGAQGRHPRSGRDVHPRHDLQPRATSRSPTSACARRSTTRSTPT